MIVVDEFRLTRGRLVTIVAMFVVLALIVVGAERIASVEHSDSAAAAVIVSQATPPSQTTADAPTPTPVEDISIVDLRTGRVSPLAGSLRSIAGAENFEVSPDGRRLAFDDGNVVYVADTDGSHVRQLTHGTDRAITPMWSPDGTEIVYAQGADRVFIADLGTGIVRALVQLPRELVWLPSFSGDGRTIMFTRTRGLTRTRGDGTRLEIWTIPASGGNPTRLFEHAAFGSYSPDGGAIAFHRAGRAVAPGTWPWDFGLVLADGDGSGRRRLTPSRCCYMSPQDWNWTRPAWSPDGSRVVYQAFGLAPDDVEVVVVATGESTRVGIGAHPSFLDEHALIVEDYRPRR